MIGNEAERNLRKSNVMGNVLRSTQTLCSWFLMLSFSFLFLASLVDVLYPVDRSIVSIVVARGPWTRVWRNNAIEDKEYQIVFPSGCLATAEMKASNIRRHTTTAMATATIVKLFKYIICRQLSRMGSLLLFAWNVLAVKSVANIFPRVCLYCLVLSVTVSAEV